MRIRRLAGLLLLPVAAALAEPTERTTRGPSSSRPSDLVQAHVDPREPELVEGGQIVAIRVPR